LAFFSRLAEAQRPTSPAALAPVNVEVAEFGKREAVA
jgi:hypothetical protein